jgi:hypothetical protein
LRKGEELPAGVIARFEVLSAVTVKILGFWDVTPCGWYIGTYVSEESRISISRVGSGGDSSTLKMKAVDTP